jgi:hypothetical protein
MYCITTTGSTNQSNIKIVLEQERIFNYHNTMAETNTGYRNTGHSNTGDRNTGYRNTGYSNTGHLNTGN